MPSLVPRPLPGLALRGARAASAAGLGFVSVMRGGRSVHPNGIAFHATLEVDPEPPGFETARLLRNPRARAAIVRLSRSIGLPEGVPDLYGAALRVLDAYGAGHHQDLLFVTGGQNGLARHLLAPARGYAGRTMSTILPYRVGQRSWVFLLRAVENPRLDGRVHSLEAVARGARERALSFELSLAPVLGGRPVRAGRLRLERPLAADAEHELRFNPANSGGGIEPVTWLNRLRPDSYRASQAARRRESPRDSFAERRAQLVAETPEREG